MCLALNQGNLLCRMSALAAELKVVLPISFFERANNAYFNSIAIIDVDGTNLGLYRKTHIPDGIGYQEKFYFIPGDTGFKVFSTAYGKIGVAICWDQWFPETARCLALQGAEVVLYPTAIGSEPKDATMNSYPHWAKTMIGHACANMVPVMASNRIGKETFEASEITFYGGSFIAGPTGSIMAQVGGQGADGNIDPNPNKEEGFAMAKFDLDALISERAAWGLFRDRRPEMYGPIATSDGRVGK
ncbi:hypothetical protein CEUSTIGMA_g9466.t1 [Chlamydomonas eustigma]|uniref:CN hydrolase domain-containing protein n=1 Tax=Chlamydomonas eustigma TaxID=1157962 RepID=A0A250XG32_9CHLO|nr:hypothetical protein CEUSTIGMA_g9466.t1 [Chlamydomonas eustigma]|eukprot:GAX82038.1 hypothetical protein CEUSTIGMA_g9466.t1 [Chlamydomonas eustigma]